jgi:hypothetical protein
MERAVIQKRVADFAANQKKFQQEREEYYAKTMADARETQWTAPRHLATATATAEPKVGPRTTLPPNSQYRVLSESSRIRILFQVSCLDAKRPRIDA